MNQKFSEMNTYMGGLFPQSVASGTLATDFVPVGDQERLAFVISVGVTGGTVDAKVQLSATGSVTGAGGVGGGTPTDLGTAYAITQIGTTGDGRVAIIEVPAAAIRKFWDTSAANALLTKIGLLITVGGSTTALIGVQIWGVAQTRPAYSRDPQENVITVGGVAEVVGG
jgi:hypothetical protein